MAKSNWRAFPAAVGPKGQQFNAPGILEHTVVEEVPYSCDMDSPHVFKVDFGSSMACKGRNANHAEDSLKFFANSTGRRCSIQSPPSFEFPNVLGGESADLDRKRVVPHSRSIISPISSSPRIPSPPPPSTLSS